VHYYKKQIGQYNNKAARLSILQHGVYNLLIDCCYDRERFPTRKDAIEWLWVSTPEEEQALDFVLNKFFIKNKKGEFVQDRIAEELEKYRARCITNKTNRNLNLTNGHESLEIVDETTTSQTQLRIKNKELPIKNKELLIRFEFLWETFDAEYGSKGNKKNAEREFKKIKPSSDLFDLIMIGLDAQIVAKKKLVLSGEFVSNFKHVERWIKTRGWEDEPDRCTSNSQVNKLSKSDKSDKAMREYLREEGINGESMENSTGLEIGTG